jgi:RNA polymerase sigma-70 factor (ECF subfamily)
MSKRAQEEFELILERFSGAIRAEILKFRLDKYGIDSDDVFQEVKIKIWKKCSDEKKISHITSYIMRVVNSTLIDHLRKFRSQERILDQEEREVLWKEKASPENPSADEERRQLIHGAVESLLESRRKVVKLFLMDLTLEEIASSLNWSKEKTRNLLYRGLADIKEKLGKGKINYDHE